MSNLPENQAAAVLTGKNSHEGFRIKDLFHLIDSATLAAKTKVDELRQKGQEAISIGEMFEMQMTMNHLSQLSEMSTSVVSASNQAINSMARSVKQ